jgi:hypothetical protein
LRQRRVIYGRAAYKSFAAIRKSVGFGSGDTMAKRSDGITAEQMSAASGQKQKVMHLPTGCHYQRRLLRGRRRGMEGAIFVAFVFGVLLGGIVATMSPWR